MHNENMKINEKINNLELYFNRENKTFIYYSIGEIENIDVCIWNLLKNFPEDNYKILTQDYTNCSIYTEHLIEDHFIYLNKLKEQTLQLSFCNIRDRKFQNGFFGFVRRRYRIYQHIPIHIHIFPEISRVKKRAVFCNDFYSSCKNLHISICKC